MNDEDSRLRSKGYSKVQESCKGSKDMKARNLKTHTLKEKMM